MVKLLIVDDEPLVQIGIKSMLNWQDFGIEICGTAVNGKQALEIIKDVSPEIVICDIKMPVMNGLELIKICREQDETFPLFIVLTSYEEFSLAQEALRYHVLDYLIKLELDPDGLKKVIQNALSILEKFEKTAPLKGHDRMGIQSFYDKFFIRLLHNLFDDEEQFRLQKMDLDLLLPTCPYVVGHAEIKGIAHHAMNQEQNMSLYSSTLQMVREILCKYMPCYVISLDIKHFSVIFQLDDPYHYREHVANALEKTFTMVHNYFNVHFFIAIGRPCETPFQISESYQDARDIFYLVKEEEPILFYENIQTQLPLKNAFNIALFKSDLTKAFEEFDLDTLTQVFCEITELFSSHSTRFLQAIDAASNILYLAISLLPDGESIVSLIFSEDPDGYRSLYRQTSTEQIIVWMNRLRDGLYKILTERKKSYKNHIVSNVQKYINEHIEERLSLNDIASIFGISPNYLSLLFKKYSDQGFSEYISQMKIARAKELITEGNFKIYEVADKLGFESAFYFSKVFKKVTGYSPRDWLQIKGI